MSIETIQIRKCDICGKEMKYGHVIITWPDGRKEDVCHDCAKKLNAKLKEMRNEVNDSFVVVGYRKIPWNRTSLDLQTTFIGKFNSQKKAEVCKEMREADFDRVLIAKSVDEAVGILLAERYEKVDE